MIDYESPTYHNGKYQYPTWAIALGWLIAAASLICIPAYALIMIARADGKTFCEVSEQRIRLLIFINFKQKNL